MNFAPLLNKQSEISLNNDPGHLAGIVIFTRQNLSSASITSFPRSTMTITGWPVLKPSSSSHLPLSLSFVLADLTSDEDAHQ
ncbi:hypothetical protein [Brenneria roseae]|uniref:hypothetical protein n=1 Tax=Brenneria roseae TaxID=1509241 RepID=UPI001FFBE68C|nr:hypothetical protein [Brenneria roseae]